MSIEKHCARAALDPAVFDALAGELGLGLVSIRETSGSTNTELADLAASGQAGNLSVYFTEHQQQGKGRLGRDWVTPAGSSLTVSVLAVPGESMPTDSLSWYTMLAALACVDHVVLMPGSHAEEPMRTLLPAVQPHVHVNGPDYGEPSTWIEWPVMQMYGTRGYTITRRNDFSTSAIVRRICETTRDT